MSFWLRRPPFCWENHVGRAPTKPRTASQQLIRAGFALHARHRFEVGTPDEKREILVTIGSNLTLLDKVLGLDLENEYAFFEYVNEIEPTVSEEFERGKRVDTSIDLEFIWAQNRLVLPD